MTMGPYYTGAGESIGLYSNGYSSTTTSTLYFSWFIYQVSPTQPSTPTGGSWDFITNTGTAPVGWSTSPPVAPTSIVWVSTSIINSATPAVTNWSTPGQFTASALYFEWSIYKVSESQPTTPTGGSWNFVTNVGTAPAGWLSTPPAYPSNTVWVATSLVSSLTPSSISWSTPGQLGGVGAQGGGVFQVNNEIANVNYTIQSGQNAFSVGPITVASGVTITVTSGQRWLIV